MIKREMINKKSEIVEEFGSSIPTDKEIRQMHKEIEDENMKRAGIKKLEEILSLERLKELEILISQTDDVKKLIRETREVAIASEELKEFIKEQKLAFNIFMAPIISHSKRINESIIELKAKVKVGYENKTWLNTTEKVNDDTGELVIKEYNNIPTGFGILKGKEKTELDMNYKYPASCYKRVLVPSLAREAIRDRKAPAKCLIVTKGNDSISWLPQNIINGKKVSINESPLGKVPK